MAITLRPQQEECVAAFLDPATWDKGRPVFVAPTGFGKTIVFSSIIAALRAREGARVLVLAHTQELVEQAEKKLAIVAPAVEASVYAAGLKRREIGSVTIASRDSIRALVKRSEAEGLALGAFDYLLIDEGHRASNEEGTSYRLIVDAYTAANPATRVAAFTATPYRMGAGHIYGEDGMFDHVAFECTLREMIEAGYLCPPINRAVDRAAIADTSAVRTSAGDFNLRQLGEAVGDANVIAAACEDWHRRAFAEGRESTLMFAVSIEHGEAIKRYIEQAFPEVTVEMVTGKTPKDERADIIEAFEQGFIHALINVAVLTEGFDAPRTDCVAIMRPTQSLGLFVQMVGRGLRLFDGKADCLVLDYGENLERFGPVDRAEPMEKGAASRVKNCPKCDALVARNRIACDCGYHFPAEAPPPQRKKCVACGAENRLRATFCASCGHALVRHADRASDADILSTGPRISRREVSEVFATTHTSRRTGQPYLRVNFRCGFDVYSDNLMIGYEGGAGRLAIIKWRKYVIGKCGNPTTPEEAKRWADGWPIWRDIKAIDVDLSSKYKDIKEVYEHDNAAIA